MLNLTPASQTGDYDPVLVPGNGIVIASEPDVGHYRSYELPSGGSYVQGTWDARLAPTRRWEGVSCSMAFGPGGAPFLQVRVTDLAAAEDGYCVISSASGVSHLINLSLTR